MAPKKRKQQESEEGEEELGSDEFVVEEEEERTPVKKKKAAPKKPRTPKSPKLTEPKVDELGWHIEPPSLMWKDFGTEPSPKIAAFDLDGTICVVKSKARFYKDADDWKFFNKKGVVSKMRELHEDGYKIVVFSNQGGIKNALEGKLANITKERVAQIVAALGKGTGKGKASQEDDAVPLQVFLAPSISDGDRCRKPATGMWDYMVEHCNGGIQPVLSQCFFVGDAAEPSHVVGDSDRRFAEAIGIEFKLPQDMFGDKEKKDDLDPAAVAAGEHGPNAELVAQFRQLADDTRDMGGNKWKANAYSAAADALATFPELIKSQHLSQVAKLKGVGKGALDKVKQFLATGHILGDEGAAAAEPKKQAAGKKAQEAMTFM